MSKPILVLDLADSAIAQQILQTQRLAYRIEADLINFDGIPQLHESLQDLHESDEIFLGFFVDKILAGVLSYTIGGNTLNIGRLVVHPDYFRRGIGKKLVRFLETLPDVQKIIVSTSALNIPARHLYEHLAYQLLEEKQIVEGLVIAYYEKALS